MDYLFFCNKTKYMKLSQGKESVYYYIDNDKDLKLAKEHLGERVDVSKIISCDTEVRMLHTEYGARASWRDPHTSEVSLLQYFIEGDEYPFIIDVLKLGIDKVKPIIDILAREDIRKVFVNAKFDLKVIYSTFRVWLPNVWCIMLMSQRIGVCSGFRASQMRGHSYRSIARDYFGIDISKVEQTSDWGNPNRTVSQLDYASLDVFSPEETSYKSIPIAAYYLFHKTLYSPAPYGFGGHCKLKNYKESIELDQEVNLLLAQMEYRGMPVSIKMLDLIYNTARVELEELKLYLCRSFGLPAQQRVEFTKDGPQVITLLSEETQKTLNNPKKLVTLVNSALRKQGVAPLNDVMSGSLEELLKKLKKKEEEEQDNQDDEDEEFYFEDEGEDTGWGIDLVDKLLKYKELVKLTGTDYRTLINPVTGRVHSFFQCIGTSTGRMSSGGKSSFNCQQISKTSITVKYPLSLNPYNVKNLSVEDRVIWQLVNMRYAFVSDREGMLWASSDFASQEARMLAVLCKDPLLKKAYLLELAYSSGKLEKPLDPDGNPYDDPNQDVHVLAAASINSEVKRLLEKEPWNCNKKKSALVAKWRQLGKILNYALMYLAQAPTISKQTQISLEEAKTAIENYFKGFHQLKLWLDSLAATALELRWIRTFTGDMIFINESNSKGVSAESSTKSKAVNHAIQAPGATQTKLALVYTDKAFKELDKKYADILNGREAELLAPIHDEENSLIPGGCNFEMVPDEELNKKLNTNMYYKPKITFDKKNPEHLMALEYQEAKENAMKQAMQETFDLIEGNEIPAGAECESGPFWRH